MTTDNYQNALDALSGALLEVDRQKATIASLREQNEHASNVAMGTAMTLGLVVEVLEQSCAWAMSDSVAEIIDMLNEGPEPTP